jgi:hypothetical protein
MIYAIPKAKGTENGDPKKTKKGRKKNEDPI